MHFFKKKINCLQIPMGTRRTRGYTRYQSSGYPYGWRAGTGTYLSIAWGEGGGALRARPTLLSFLNKGGRNLSHLNLRPPPFDLIFGSPRCLVVIVLGQETRKGKEWKWWSSLRVIFEVKLVWFWRNNQKKKKRNDWKGRRTRKLCSKQDWLN